MIWNFWLGFGRNSVHLLLGPSPLSLEIMTKDFLTWWFNSTFSWILISQNSISIVPYILKLLNHLHKNLHIENFPTITRVHPNFPNFFCFDYLELYCPIFSNSCTIILKPSWCTPSHWGLSNSTKCGVRGHIVWEIITWQTNNQPSIK